MVLAEFIAVWSLIAGLVICPWISGPAVTDTGRFLSPYSIRVWAVCAGFLYAGLLALLIFFRRAKANGTSVARAARTVGSHFIVTAIILVVGFIVADFVMTWVKPLPAAARLDVPNARIYGWGYAPYQRISWMVRDTGEIFHERVNSRGWRDVEHAAPKTCPRLLLLGDSQAFGAGVAFDQAIGRQLQQILGDRCEVITIAVPGWGTDQELLALNHEGWSYQPDVVVLFMTLGNDVLNNMYDHSLFGTAPKPRFRLVDDSLEFDPLPPWRHPFLRRLLGRSTICGHLKLWYMARHVEIGSEAPQLIQQPGSEEPILINYDPAFEDIENDNSHYSIFTQTWSERVAEGWRLTLRLIQEVEAACRSHSATLVVYAYCQAPSPTPFSIVVGGKTYILEPDKPFRLLREFCLREGIVWVDEPGNYRAEAWMGVTRYRVDGHLNALGNRRAAELLAQWIDERGLFGQPGSGVK